MTAERSPEFSGLPCMLMRGGTSKGAYFLARDLPSDRAQLDDLLLRIMGSPDARQIDGLGGAHPLTSKVAIVSPSDAPGVDVDYLFLQVGVDTDTIADSQTCGNLLAGVGPFAVERGLVAAGEPLTSVNIRLMNTGDVATATFPTRSGAVVSEGDAAIDGVPGTAAPIELEMVGSGGTPILPTGNPVDIIANRRVTLADCGMPVVVLDAAEFDLTGAESPEALESNRDLIEHLERIRLRAGRLMGLGDVAEQTVPKMFLLSPPRAGGAVTTRAFIPHRVHTSIGVLMAASVAATVRIPGTVGNALAVMRDGPLTLLEHPEGAFEAHVEVEHRHGVGFVVSRSVTLRTARKIFDGLVFPRPHR